MKSGAALPIAMISPGLTLVAVGDCSQADDVSMVKPATTTLEAPDTTFIDRDKQTCRFEKTIGSQVWMAENQRYLPVVVSPASGSDWKAEPYHYVYGYDGTTGTEAKATKTYQIYGALYNWAAAMAGSESSNISPNNVQGICPMGWHLPSNDEWAVMIEYLGGEKVAQGALKETGSTHWPSPNIGATDAVGCTGLPGGYRHTDSTFKEIGKTGYWSSAAEHYKFDYLGFYRYLSFEENMISVPATSKADGFSVRCVRD